jgi:acyl-CoA synthetase (AMP-forming)/AMP-acid ligase II
VAEVCVWKRPDPEWGERVVAYIVAKPGTSVSLESLRGEVDDLAPWERPKEVILVSELPRTASGKVARRLLS